MIAVSFFLICWSYATGIAQTSPAVIPGDFADPTVIRTAKGYYAAGTSSEWAPHFPVYHSTDLKKWTQTGYIFEKAPEWTAGSFWAPEYYRIGETYYLYYVARRKSDKISCIGVATSKYPDREFKDHGIIIDYGKEAIDPFIFKDGGQLYITFKAYGLDKRPIEILADKLSPDGLKAKGEIISLFKDESKIGLEGQAILKKGKFYYLFYSAGNCCGADCSYHLKLARATRFGGPYEKYQTAELLKPTEGFKCAGHGTFVKNTSGKTFYLGHAYNERSNVFTGREAMLSALTWPNENGWPDIEAVNTTMPLQGFKADFNTTTPGLYWQYDFQNSLPIVKHQNGKFHLSGKVFEKNTTGIVYGVRTITDHFAINTTVENENTALKGLSLYGTVNAAVGIGVMNREVCAWIATDGKFEKLDSVTISGKGPLQLRMIMLPGQTCKMYYKERGNDWKELPAERNIPINFLPQWDRAPRAGLFFRGTESESAVFSDFSMDIPLRE
ncbi:MAG: beta-xylosidase [Chitinophagaceae bacterium]|nr:MAG: beta-xylosidase [Chitinophagaceae bacterium]